MSSEHDAALQAIHDDLGAAAPSPDARRRVYDLGVGSGVPLTRSAASDVAQVRRAHTSAHCATRMRAAAAAAPTAFMRARVRPLVHALGTDERRRTRRRAQDLHMGPEVAPTRSAASGLADDLGLPPPLDFRRSAASQLALDMADSMAL